MPTRSVALIIVLGLFGLPGFGQSQPAAQPVLPASVDDAPAIREFPKDLLKNFSGLWSRDNLVPLLVGTAATTAALPFDDHVVTRFDDPLYLQGFDGVGNRLGMSIVVGPVIGVSFLASRMTDNAKFQRVTYDLGQGFIVVNTLTTGLKAVTNRQRPDGSNDLSFPSGHTSNSFMWATVVSRHYGWKKALPAYAFASYVGASRLKSRKHHVTDVVAGAALGYIVGRTVTRRGRDAEKRRLRLGVAVPPGGGAALKLGIRLW